MKKKPSLTRSILLGLAIVVGIIVYAYGFEVTNVNFEKTRSEDRLTQLQRIIRALAHPNVIEYEQEEIFIDADFYLPCPAGGAPSQETDTSGPHLVLDPPCEEAGEFIVVRGYQFPPESQGPINFVAASGVSLTLGNFESDSAGAFEVNVKLPNRQPVEEAQTIRAISRKNIGRPHFSPVALATWDKIVETVFLALLATTFGTLLAIPISFLAARNLMSDVKSPIASAALSILGVPLGIGISGLAVGWLRNLSELLTTNTALSLGSMFVSLLAIWAILRWTVPTKEGREPSPYVKTIRLLASILAAALFILAAYLIANLLFVGGEAMMDILGSLDFLGFFTSQLGEVLRMITPAVAALAGAAAMSSALSGFGLLITERLTASSVKIANTLLAALAGAVLFAIIGAAVEWLYQIGDPVKTLWIPGGVGAILGIILSLRAGPKDLLPIGFTIYYVMRTVLNAIRSIEPLVMVIVFVVWVGIGPFAGALALALHTIAALAKLYSEQVESISHGPIEAVTATGANRLQMIVYAVVPQIIPPYISFTMYRWDINVRMSTIIGFAGGGGIGFLLQQNINLLNYRAASVQMLAIAIVVATMDYTSALIRERFV